MSALPHTSANPASETPSTSETAVGGSAGSNLVPGDTTSTDVIPDERVQDGPEAAKERKGSAEDLAEKVFAEREEGEAEQGS